MHARRRSTGRGATAAREDHLSSARRNKAAIIWEGELKLPLGRPAQQELKFTYSYTEDGRMKCSFLDIESGEDTEIDLDMARKASDSTSTDIDKFKVE